MKRLKANPHRPGPDVGASCARSHRTDAPSRVCHVQVEGLLVFGFDAESLRAIECENALRLIPRWRA